MGGKEKQEVKYCFGWEWNPFLQHLPVEGAMAVCLCAPPHGSGSHQAGYASPGLRRVRVEKHVPCVMESLPLSQLLPSTSYCPTLTPPLSDLDQGLFMAVLMLDHPTITLSSLPTSPPCLHLLHCTRLYLTSPRTFSPFLLPTLSPDATHQALCSVGTSLVPVCHV